VPLAHTNREIRRRRGRITTTTLSSSSSFGAGEDAIGLSIRPGYELEGRSACPTPGHGLPIRKERDAMRRGGGLMPPGIDAWRLPPDRQQQMWDS
jgi:hypothetical protein